MMAKRIFFSAGEPSGDLHAAALIRELGRRYPEFECRGFGGPQMLQAGMRQDFDLTQLAVVGFVEVLPKLREFFRLKAVARDLFRGGCLDAVVVVDFPGFNWHIAAEASRAGIPVIYYLPPQLWAWGQHRIKKVRRHVDFVISALPIEHDYYASRGVRSEFVGHPFFDHVSEGGLDREWIASVTAKRSKRVAVLPGSRSGELRHLWPLQLEVIRRVHAAHPEVVFDVACLREEHAGQCRRVLQSEGNSRLPVAIHCGRTSEVLEASQCVLMKSGSTSLEVMARGKPAVVMYHVSRSTHFIARRLMKVPFMSLPNIIAGREIQPEFLAVGSSREVIDEVAGELGRLIASPAERDKQREALSEVYRQCGGPGATGRAAAAIGDALGWNAAADTPIDRSTPGGRLAA